uniref:Uncharacterized protein n=1 Tax=Megaselia scalaris TaxID=36166 RepID=T1H059_MEGSC
MEFFLSLKALNVEPYNVGFIIFGNDKVIKEGDIALDNAIDAIINDGQDENKNQTNAMKSCWCNEIGIGQIP